MARKIERTIPLIVGLLSVSYTFISHENELVGERGITACFSSIVVSDGSTQSDLALQSSCLNAKNYADILNPSSHIYIQSAAVPVDICSETLEEFCCAKVEETTDARAALIDIGDGFRSYKILQILCHD